MPGSLDLISLLYDDLTDDSWGKDGLLHASELVDPLRHVMLRMAGAPRLPKSYSDLVVLETGKMWHERVAKALAAKHKPFMHEVNITPGLPPGWGGQADYIVWDSQYNGFVLYDLKTTKSTGLQYIARDGAKKEHMWQVSAYWWALKKMGYPMLNRVGILYLPKDEDYSSETPSDPIMAEVQPLPGETIKAAMLERQDAVQRYLAKIDATLASANYYLNDELAPVEPKVQRVFKKGDVWEVKLIPHWTSMFCPYPDEICPCAGLPGENKTTKIGQFEQVNGSWVYKPRKGYEETHPEVRPMVR